MNNKCYMTISEAFDTMYFADVNRLAVLSIVGAQNSFSVFFTEG